MSNVLLASLIINLHMLCNSFGLMAPMCLPDSFSFGSFSIICMLHSRSESKFKGPSGEADGLVGRSR